MSNDSEDDLGGLPNPDRLVSIFSENTTRQQVEKALADAGYTGSYTSARREYLILRHAQSQFRRELNHGHDKLAKTNGSKSGIPNSHSNGSPSYTENEDKPRKNRTRKPADRKIYRKPKEAQSERPKKRYVESSLYLVYPDPKHTEGFQSEEKARGYVEGLVGHVDFSKVEVYRKINFRVVTKISIV